MFHMKLRFPWRVVSVVQVIVSVAKMALLHDAVLSWNRSDFRNVKRILSYAYASLFEGFDISV